MITVHVRREVHPGAFVNALLAEDSEPSSSSSGLFASPPAHGGAGRYSARYSIAEGVCLKGKIYPVANEIGFQIENHRVETVAVVLDFDASVNLKRKEFGERMALVLYASAGSASEEKFLVRAVVEEEHRSAVTAFAYTGERAREEIRREKALIASALPHTEAAGETAIGDAADPEELLTDDAVSSAEQVEEEDQSSVGAEEAAGRIGRGVLKSLSVKERALRLNESAPSMLNRSVSARSTDTEIKFYGGMRLAVTKK